MTRYRSFLLATSLCAALFGAAPAQAAPVNVNATLTAQAIGTGSPFGFVTLPAGPFTASLIFSGPLSASATISSLAALTSAGMTDFAFTIGTVTFTEDDLLFGSLATDAAGLVTSLYLSGNKSDLSSGFTLDVPAFFGNVMWSAGQGSCGFSVGLPLTISGRCIAGEPGSAVLSQVTYDPTPMSAPGSLALVGAALLALGAARRRSLTAAPVAAGH